MSEKGRKERLAKQEARKKTKKKKEVQSDDRCVVYFNTGSRCLVRLVTSLYSLRKHWSGRVCVILEGDHPEWVFQAFHSLKITCKRVQMDIPKLKGVKEALVRKPFVPDYVEAGRGVFLDSDTVVLDKIDELFELPKGKSFGTTAFSKWA